MAAYYLDASAVVKYYHMELGSDWVRQRIDAQDEAEVYLYQWELRELDSAIVFVTSDEQLGRAARAEGLQVENPATS